MDKREALDWFLRRKSMKLDDKCQAAEDIAIECIMREIDGDWIRVEEKLPEEHDTIFAKLKGTEKWHPSMFAKASDDVRVVVRFDDGTRMVSHDHTFDGKWDCETKRYGYKRTVTHWMPNPDLPKED